MRTDEKSKIIETLRLTPVVEYACRKHGVARSTYYQWRQDDKYFARRADSALGVGRHVTNDMAEGVIIGKIKDKDLGAAKFWLEHHSDAYKKKKDMNTVINVTKGDMIDIVRKIEPVINQDKLKKKEYKKLLRVCEIIYPVAVQSGLIQPGTYDDPTELVRMILESTRQKKERYYEKNNLKSD